MSERRRFLWAAVLFAALCALVLLIWSEVALRGSRSDLDRATGAGDWGAVRALSLAPPK